VLTARLNVEMSLDFAQAKVCGSAFISIEYGFPTVHPRIYSCRRAGLCKM
jgi:hypothetical protein